jgi:hypothetical protein
MTGAYRRSVKPSFCSRDPAQPLLEHPDRLAALDQVAIVDDDRQHRTDAERLPVVHQRSYFAGELMAFEHRASPLDVEPGFVCGTQQHLVRSRVVAALVVRR